jgi:hypothetical protein
MKKIFFVCFLSLGIFCMQAQEKQKEQTRVKSSDGSSSAYGNTLNLAIGLAYGNAYGQSFPLLANYELDVAKNFTLAPFISFYTYTNYSYWGPYGKPYRNYYYRTTVIPIGIKAFYYFDELILANEKWDFYAAASLGYAFRSTRWDDGYAGPSMSYTTSSAYIDIHAGAEYHLNPKVGLFLDMSTGVSSFGISIKTK